MGNISDFIRLARLKKGFSQDYLGHLLDISQQAYSDIERQPENSRFKTILKIARLLDIDLSDMQ